MQVHVALYGGARVVSGKSTVDLSFDAPTVTLAQMLEKLIATYPLVRPYLLDVPGMLQTSIRVLINKERPEPDATLETALYDGDLVTLLVAVAGGCHTTPRTNTCIKRMPVAGGTPYYPKDQYMHQAHACR